MAVSSSSSLPTSVSSFFPLSAFFGSFTLSSSPFFCNLPFASHSVCNVASAVKEVELKGSVWDVWDASVSDFGYPFENIILLALPFLFLLVGGSCYFFLRLQRKKGERPHPYTSLARSRRVGIVLAIFLPLVTLLMFAAFPFLSPLPRVEEAATVWMCFTWSVYLWLQKKEVSKGRREAAVMKTFWVLVLVVYTLKLQSMVRRYVFASHHHEEEDNSMTRLSSVILIISFSLNYFVLLASAASYLFIRDSHIFCLSSSVHPISLGEGQILDCLLLVEEENRWPIASTSTPSSRGKEGEGEEEDGKGKGREGTRRRRTGGVRDSLMSASSSSSSTEGCSFANAVGDESDDLDEEEWSYKSGQCRVLPETKAGLFSIITFGWMSSLIALGKSRPLQEEDLYDLNPKEKAKVLAEKVRELWEEEIRDQPPERRTITRVLRRAYLKTFFIAGCFKLCYDCLMFLGPIMLNRIVTFLKESKSPSPPPESLGFSYVAILFGANLLQSVALHQYFHRQFRLGMRLRSSVISLTYRKALRLLPGMAGKVGRDGTLHDGPAKSSGEIVNLIAVDAQRLQDLMTYLHILWSAPLQIVVALFLLYENIGVSAFGGLFVMVVSIPITGLVAKITRAVQNKVMKVKDERIKVTNEVLGGMKIIKLYSWENSFLQKLLHIRQTELSLLWRYQLTVMFSRLQWMAVPVLVAIATFSLYTILGNTLDAASAFTSLSLFNILRFPMQLLPYMVNNLAEAMVSINRINEFLLSPELPELPPVPSASSQPQPYFSSSPSVSASGGSSSTKTASSSSSSSRLYVDAASVGVPLVDLHGVTLRWPDGSELLRNISLKVNSGQLTAIVGPTGCGKSGLLSAMIGDVLPESGELSISGRIAYVSQVAWIQNCTVKENICFGRPYDQVLYDRVIEACALSHDLQILPAGDLTEIGEKGINLSGGQKQRVALARAVYQEADVYLLDDFLSAVDAHVAKHIFSHCLLEMLREKTVIIITHKMDVLPYCDQLVFIRNGGFSFVGKYDNLCDLTEFRELSAQQRLQEQQQSESEEGKEGEERSSADRESSYAEAVESSGLIVTEGEEKEAEKKRNGSMQEIPMMNEGEEHRGGGEIRRRFENEEVKTVKEEEESPYEKEYETKIERRASISSDIMKTSRKVTLADDELKVKLQKEMNRQKEGALIEKEYLMAGSVSAKIYWEYIRCAGGFLAVLFILLTLISTNAAQIGSNAWLSHWSDSRTISSREGLGGYAVFCGSQIVLSFISFFCVGLASIRAARVFFRGLLIGIMRAPMMFFDTIPLGRILNRFSKDTYTIDEQLPATFVMYLNTMFSVLATFSVITFVVPWFLVVLFPLLIFYIFVQNYYIPSSRQLQRLESVLRSPIFSHLSESLDGAPTIRAYRKQRRFIKKAEAKLDNNLKAYYLMVSSNRWLAVRLEFVGSVIVTSAALLAILGSGELAPGMGGLAISYALSVTQTLNWMVRMASDRESNIVSVERVYEYSHDIPSEAAAVVLHNRPAEGWPQEGKISFKNYSLRYRPLLPLVLEDLNITVEAGEKIGIVGRTGAGKSSMMLGLLRLVEPESGVIEVDSVDISKIGLRDLRSKFSIIPQDPVLFTGTVRFNIDPFEEHSDAAIWMSLEGAHLKDHIVSMGGTDPLSFIVEEGGKNFSMGQRQLLCLARALLRHSKVLLLDEATSVVDPQTDTLIQETIRRQFASCTVLTIAHRVDTILDYDRILVLSNGRVEEFDTPVNLMNDKRGAFRKLAEESGISSLTTYY